MTGNNPTIETTHITIRTDVFNGLVADAYRFRLLQNMPVVRAQAYFWNFSSRKQRAEEIDADMRRVIETIVSPTKE